jgi:hypothetical protein
MGTWGLLGIGFFIGLCVGQGCLALFLGLFRKNQLETIIASENLPSPEHDTLISVIPTRP